MKNSPAFNSNPSKQQAHSKQQTKPQQQAHSKKPRHSRENGNPEGQSKISNKNNMQIYKLHFDSDFHVDSIGNNAYSKSEKFIHSDTLSSAILSLWAIQKPESFKIDETSPPPYLLSSAFSFLGDILFLPAPKGRFLLCKPKTDDNQINNAIKKSKKIEFLSLGLWEQFIKDPKFCLKNLYPSDRIVPVSVGVQDYSFENKNSYKNNVKKESEACFLISTKEHDTWKEKALKQQSKNKQGVKGSKPIFYKEEKRQRTSVSRNPSEKTEEEQKAKLFQFSSVRYSKGSGLYFLAQFKTATAQKDFEQMLSLLGDTGLGADRSSGKGQFLWTKEDSPINSFYNPEPSFTCNLSVFSPSKEEIKNTDWIEDSKTQNQESEHKMGYELIKRGGWIHNQSLRKNSLFMFKEGSCFTYKKPLKGSIKDVTPTQSPHKVWRDGRAFWVYF